MLEFLVALLGALCVGAVTVHGVYAIVGDATIAWWAGAVVAALLAAAWTWTYVRMASPALPQKPANRR